MKLVTDGEELSGLVDELTTVYRGAFGAGACVGFAYGYTGRRGQWWTDQIAARAPADVVERWLDGHFEFVELAVDPAVQRRGHGAALHDVLLRGISNTRALLTTYRDDRPAPRLCRRLGWVLLVDGVFEDSDLYGLDVRRRSQRLER